MLGSMLWIKHGSRESANLHSLNSYSCQEDARNLSLFRSFLFLHLLIIVYWSKWGMVSYLSLGSICSSVKKSLYDYIFWYRVPILIKKGVFTKLCHGLRSVYTLIVLDQIIFAEGTRIAIFSCTTSPILFGEYDGLHILLLAQN